MFSDNLVNRLKSYFRVNYDKEIINEEAQEYLNSFADLFDLFSE